MDGVNGDIIKSKKKVRNTEREFNTALFLLRCIELGLSDNDMEQLTYGMVIDIMTERGNDNFNYMEVATQEDFDKF